MSHMAFLSATHLAARHLSPFLRHAHRATAPGLAPAAACPTLPLFRTVSTAVLRPKVAIVGGGHAGVATALRLATLPWTRLTRPSITLVNQSNRFCFLPMLYELAFNQVAQWEIAPRFTDLLVDTPIHFEHARVEALDLATGSLHARRITESSLTPGEDVDIPFDRTVLALGAQPAYIDSVPGASEHALPFYTMLDAIALKNKLSALRDTTPHGRVINAVVVGAGFSGVELASCLAEHLGSAGSVLVVETSDSALRAAAPFNRRTALKALSANGVVVEYNSRVSAVRSDGVTLTRTESDHTASVAVDYPADLVLWTAGSKPSVTLPDLGLPLDGKGRVRTDRFQQVAGLEGRVFALGDAASAPAGTDFSGTAQVAIQQAEYAAWNVWASLTEKPMLPFRYTHLGEMMVLGADNATVASPLGVEIEGQAAWVARRVAYLARLPTDGHRARVAASWAVNPLLQGMSSLVDASREYRSGGL